MPFLILVATPHAAFGEMLRMSLEDSGQYQVRMVQSGKEARTASSHSVFQLAIIDAALQDEPFVPLCKELLHQQTGLRLVIIPPENNPNHPSLGGLMPHGYLSRPFYLPDLIDTVSRLLADRDQQLQSQRLTTGEMAPANPPAASLPPWLQEPLTLRGYMEKELVNTQALGAIIGLSAARPGTGILRANAGKLDDASAHELSSVVFRYWNRNEKTDLMRFIRISRDKKDYLVYATQVTGDLVLVLIYDTAAPLSLIRPQSKNMAQNLASVPPDGYHYPTNPSAPFTEPDYLYQTVDKQPAATGQSLSAVDKSQPGAGHLQTESAGNQPADEKPQPAIQLPASWAGSAPVDQPSPDNGAVKDGAMVKAPGSDQAEPGEPASVAPFLEGETGFRSAIIEPETQPLNDGDLEDGDFLRRLRSGFALGDEPATGNSTSDMASSTVDPGTEKPSTETPKPSENAQSVSGAPQVSPLSSASPFLAGLEDEDEIATDIINLTALLGSIPPPDPSTGEMPGASWIPERFAGFPIPTLTPNGVESFSGSASTSGGDTVPGRELAGDIQNAAQPALDKQALSEAKPETNQSAEATEAGSLEKADLPDMPDHAEKLAADELMATDELLSSDSGEVSAKPERIPAGREIKTEPPTPIAGPTPILPQPPSRSLLRRKSSEQSAGLSDTVLEENRPAVPEMDRPEGEAVQPPATMKKLPISVSPVPPFNPEDDLDLDIEEPEVNPLEDTRPRVVASITHLSQLESASPALSLLNYTCVLVPRLPQHYLTGELADKLALWVHQLCLAFGWRLEGIAIRPEYLQWSVQVAPAISPGNLVKIIRQRTSIHIFSTYDHLAQQNPSGDFWAPGYLIVSGAQPPSAQLLRDYIIQTRKRQGINK